MLSLLPQGLEFACPMCILAASSWPTAFDFDFKFKPFVPLKHTSEDYLQLHSCTNEVLHMFLCEFPVPQSVREVLKISQACCRGTCSSVMSLAM